MTPPQESLSCPACRESISQVLEYVTERREYQFSLTHNSYVGRSDPVDDTAKLDYVACPNCFEPLPESLVERLFEQYDAFTLSP